MSKYEIARKAAITKFEREWLFGVLSTGRTVSQTAKDEGIDRVYMHRLMRRHGVTFQMARAFVPENRDQSDMLSVEDGAVL